MWRLHRELNRATDRGQPCGHPTWRHADHRISHIKRCPAQTTASEQETGGSWRRIADSAHLTAAQLGAGGRMQIIRFWALPGSARCGGRVPSRRRRRPGANTTRARCLPAAMALLTIAAVRHPPGPPPRGRVLGPRPDETGLSPVYATARARPSSPARPRRRGERVLPPRPLPAATATAPFSCARSLGETAGEAWRSP